MNDRPILTDALVERMLVYRVDRGTSDGLHEAISVQVAGTPQVRPRPWARVVVPTPQSPPLRIAWLVALVALLLAATISAIFVGSQLLRRADQLSVVVPPTVPLTITAHPEGVAALAWSPEGVHLVTASRPGEGRDSEAKVWDAGTGEELLRFTTGDAGTTRAVIAYSPDGTRLALGKAVYDAATGDVLLGELSDRFLAYSPDGTRIAIGGGWGWAAVVDASTGEELLALSPLCPGPISMVLAAAWSPDDTRLATTCGTSVRVWDVATEEWLNIASHVQPTWAGGRLTDVAWSPDGTRIATVAHDNPDDNPDGSDGWMAEVWDASTGEELVSLSGRTGDVLVVAWNPDGTRIATAGHDGSARIWDAASGTELATLTGHAAEVTDVAWSPDGARIATASDDGTARIWPVDPPPVEPAPTASPASTSAPAVVLGATLPPLTLDPVGAPAFSDTALGTVTWRFYNPENEGAFAYGGGDLTQFGLGGGDLFGAPRGPVTVRDGTDLLWLDPDGTRQGMRLPGTISGLVPVAGDGLVAYDPWRPRLYRLTWDGTRWVFGDGFDVPSVSGSVWQVAAGPHGLLVVANGTALARDGEHFVAVAQPPGGAAPGGRVLATADGFVALLSPSEPNGISDPLLEPVPWFSADGLAWEPASAASPFGERTWIQSVAGRDGRFVAAGNIGSERGPWAGWVSDDGLAWERLPDLGLDEAEGCAKAGPSSDDCGIGVTAGNAGWVIYTWYSSASATTPASFESFASSADGLTWEPFPVWPADHDDWSGSWGSGALWPPHAELGGDTIVVTGLPIPRNQEGYWAAPEVVGVGTIEP